MHQVLLTRPNWPKPWQHGLTQKYMKQTIEEAFLVFSLVSERLGKSRFHKRYPVFAYESDEDDYGYYYPEDNEIIISDKALESREQLLRTVLHEYTHYLQDPYELALIKSEDEAYAAEEQWKDYE